MDKIICLGKNYSEHILEMNEPASPLPVLFLKPPSTMVEIKDGMKLHLPWNRGVIHFECEIVFKLYKKNIIGLGLGLDLTLRDVQKELKTQGHPWETSKVFKHSAIVTPIKGLKEFGDWRELPFSLTINGEIRQRGKMSKALMGPDEIIHFVDRHFPICDSDLVFTGTPKGVGPLSPGDKIELNFGPISHYFTVVDNG